MSCVLFVQVCGVSMRICDIECTGIVGEAPSPS